MGVKPLSKEHNQWVRNKLAEQGTEMTLEELSETRKLAFANIRKYMRERGHDVPDSDEELLLLIVAAKQKSNGSV